MTATTARQMAPRDFAKIVRKHLRAVGFTGSVRVARGTSYGWIDIAGSGDEGEFTQSERATLESLGIHPAANCNPVSPDARSDLLTKLGA